MSFPTSPDPGEAATFGAPASPLPSPGAGAAFTFTIPEDDDGTSTPTRSAAAGRASGATTDLPLTMAASLILTTLPRDAQTALREATAEDPSAKVKILFRPAPGAPTLSDPRGRLSASARFERVVIYLRKKLGVKASENLFLYVNSVFAPALDENVGNLFRCFSTNDQLVVSYSMTPAFG